MREGTLALAAAFSSAGFLLGLLYFAALRLSADFYGRGGGSLAPAALALARFGAIALFLALAAREGALPLLSAFAGFLLARAFALRSGAPG